jgi:hypothetical protein
MEVSAWDGAALADATSLQADRRCAQTVSPSTAAWAGHLTSHPGHTLFDLAFGLGMLGMDLYWTE